MNMAQRPSNPSNSLRCAEGVIFCGTWLCFAETRRPISSLTLGFQAPFKSHHRLSHAVHVIVGVHALGGCGIVRDEEDHLSAHSRHFSAQSPAASILNMILTAPNTAGISYDRFAILKCWLCIDITVSEDGRLTAPVAMPCKMPDFQKLR